MADEVSSATPVAAPVATPSPAPAAPAAPSPAAAATTQETSQTNQPPAESGADPAALASAGEAAKPGKPERASYGDNIEKFLRETYAWEEANGEARSEVTGDEILEEAAGDPIKEKPPAADEKAESEATTEDAPAENPVEETSDITPEALAGLIAAKPERKAMLDADPELKGTIFAMARQNAKAAPILEVFPNVEAAQFANEAAGTFVGMKTAFELSDSPEKMAEAAGQFLEQFAVVDDKGNPVLDAKGQPTYGEDLDLFVDHIKTRDRSIRMAELKSRVEGGKYASDEARETDEQLLAAYQFIDSAEKAGPTDPDRPDTSQMSPEAKAYFEKREKELSDERERLGLKEKTFSKKEVVATREKYDRQYREQFGASAGRYMANYLQQKEKEGVVIPRYMLTMTDPKTGIPVFAQNAFQRLNEKLSKTPNFRATSATLQMNAINDQALKARLEFAQTNGIDANLPGIIDEILHEAGVSIKEDVDKQVALRNARRTDARVEPAAGSPTTPRNLSDAQVWEKAKANVETKFKGQYVDPAKRIAEQLKERDRLESQR